MVGKNWKKILAVGICGLMAAGVISYNDEVDNLL